MFGNNTDISKPLTSLFKQTSGAGLSEDMLTQKITEMQGQDAFVIKNSKVSFGKLHELPFVQALACSTNFDPNEAPDWVSLDCNSTMVSNVQLRSSAIGDTLKVLCPAFCLDSSAPVYGNFS